MRNTLKLIATDFKKLNIDTYFVGGCVRDELLGIESDDIDICLVGVTDKSVVMRVLSQYATSVAEEVGEKFPVWIADIEGFGKVDFALARTERKDGTTRKDFEVSTDNVTIEEDLLRRDLTINAIAKDILTGVLVDPFGGVIHLRESVAHHVSEAFAEDTLRVLRTARFCARFNLTPSPELIEMCKKLKPTDISNERVGMELAKAMKQAQKPSTFFNFLREVGWLGHYFGELEALIGIQQDPTHHPEGDAYTHTLLTIDQAKDEFTRIVMFCHDFGKATTTKWNETKGKWQAIGHEEAGVVPATQMLNRVKWGDKKRIEQIGTLIELHMIHTKTISDKVVRCVKRQLHGKGLTYNQLVEVCRCDVSGRHPLPKHTPDIRQDFAETVDVTPIVTGKLLIEMGMKPGPEMGKALAKCIEWQDRGTLTKDNWKEMIKNNLINLV